MAEDKTRLLRSLAIDRGHEAVASPPRRRWPKLMAAVGAVAATTVLAVLFVPEIDLTWRSPGPAAPAAQEQPAPRAPDPAAAAEPARRGTLVASGYVVARRKATVA